MVSTFGKDVYLLFLVYFDTIGTDLTLTTAFRSTSFCHPTIIVINGIQLTDQMDEKLAKSFQQLENGLLII